jgi:hypothetical protein
MLEKTVARLLQEASQKNDQGKKNIVFCEVIFEYVVSYPNLTTTEKLTWLVIDKTVQRSPDLTACLSYRTIGQAINVSKETAYRIVRNLKAQQFLLASLNDDNNEVIYTTSLPEDGVALLKQVLEAQGLEEKTTQLNPILARAYAVLVKIRRKFR